MERGKPVSLRETLVVCGDLSCVDEARRFVRGIAGRLNMPDDKTYHLDLAVVEACTNIARHAYPGRKGDIHIASWTSEGLLYFEVRDDGPAFDPLEVEEPDLERYMREGKKGGFGCFLIRSLVDGLTYRRENEQNVLTLWMKLP